METGNAAQVEYWNTRVGQTWAAMQPLLDRQIGPLGLRAMDALSVRAGARVLDIGCGCGDTTLELARRIGPQGVVLGLDLSNPMLDVARARAKNLPQVRFQQADAQVAQFQEKFDAAYSRFGVMFFIDPVAAFRAIRAALVPGGRLGFLCWRRQEENPWMTGPIDAARSLLPPQPQSDPLAPGPLAFADGERVRRILTDAGFVDVDVAANDQEIGGLTLDDTLFLALRVGPLGRALNETPEAREAAAELVRRALLAHAKDGLIWLPSATWIVTARTV